MSINQKSNTIRKLCLMGTAVFSLSTSALAADHLEKAQPINQWLGEIHLNNLSVSNGADQQLLDVKRNLVNFYKNTTITKSFVDDKGVTIDCIPFDKQLALIDKPQSFIDQAYRNYQLHGPKTPQDTRCPVGDVVVARPFVDNMNNNNPDAFFKKAPKKTQHANKPSQSSHMSNGQTPDYLFYNWVDTGSHSMRKDWEVAYSSLSMGSNPKMPAYSYGHSLGQMWVLNDNPRYDLSLEAGIIRSKDDATEAGRRPTFFIFASVDDYGKNSCYNGMCGHFIQFPNTRPVNDIAAKPTDLLGYDGPTDVYTFAYRQYQQDDTTHRYNYYFSISDGTTDPAQNKTDTQNDTLGYYDFSTADVDTSNPDFFKIMQSGGELVSQKEGAYPRNSVWEMGSGDVHRQQSDLNTAAVYAYGDAKGFFTQQTPDTVSYLTNQTRPSVLSQAEGGSKYFDGYTHDVSRLKAWPYKNKPTIPDTIKGFNNAPLKMMAYGGSMVFE